MKETLSIILALVMLLSTLSYAAPTMVGTVETTQEVAVDAAEVFKAEAAEETTPVEEAADLQADSEYGRLIYNLDLEETNNKNGVFYNGGEVSTGWKTWQQVPKNSSSCDFSGFDGQMYFLNYNGNDKLYVVDDGTGNKMFKYDARYKWSRLNLIAGAATSFYPAGDYTLVYDLWIDEKYDWSTSHLTQLSTSVASSGENDGNVEGGIITLSNPNAKLTNGTNKLTNTIKFRTVANTTNRFQIMQDATWNNSNTDLTVTSNVSNLTFTYYLDNIKLYYQGPATVTFSSSVEATVPAAVTNVLPGTKLDLSDYKATVADENKVFFGWSLTEGGAVVTELEVLKDTTLYAVYRDAITETHPTYGQLAYWVDFDNGALTGAKIDYYKTTTKVVKAPAGMPDAYGLSVVTFNSGTEPKIAEGTMQTDGGYPRINIAADAQNPFPDGYYTVVYAAKASTSTGANNSVMANGADETLWSTGEAPIVAECAALTTELAEYSVSFTKYDEYLERPDGKKLSSSKTSIMDDLGKIGVYFTVKDNDRTVVRLLDYMKVYYMPFADVTFDANGKDVAVPTSVTDIHKIKLADYTCQTAGTSRFVGWSATPNGKLITEEEIVISSDTTLYAVWDDNFEPSAAEADAGYLLANLHFNGKANTNNTNSQIFNYGTVGKNEYVSGTSFPKVNTGDASGRIWFGGSATAGDPTSKFLYDEVHVDNEYVRTASKSSGDEVFPKVDLALFAGSLADGIYTFASEVYIPAGQENVASAKYNTYVNVNGDKAVGKHDIAIGERVYVVDSILILNGKIYDPETMEQAHTFTPGTDRVEKFGLNFIVKAVDASKPTTVSVHADNFKIYYKPYTYAPKSYNVNSIRVNSPSGIRFKASVSTIERNHNELTEYGYIVARKVTLDKLVVAENELKMENTALTKGTHYVQGVSYGMVDGKKVDKIFEKNGNVTFFTAVVYNIPSNMYDDVIVVRPYVMLGETAVYGEPMTASIKEVAERLKASEDYEKYQTVVDKILKGEEI